MSISTVGYAAFQKGGPLEFHKYNCRQLTPNDVHIKILYCGICHSDVSIVNSEWERPVNYPVVPGHEIIGEVHKVGSNVDKFKIGDFAGVGCFGGSCKKCKACKENSEPYCSEIKLTYNSNSPDGFTKGGFAKDIVVQQDWVFLIPKEFHQCLAETAPLLCAGITVYSPLMYHKINEKKNVRVGVIGLGGLGHVAVKMAKACGAVVTVISSNNSKKETALSKFKADAFICSKDEEAVNKAHKTIDFIIDTVSGCTNVEKFVQLLDFNGVYVIVGLPPKEYSMNLKPGILVNRRLAIQGSLVGGIKETESMLSFCAKHKVLPEINLIKFEEINDCFHRLSTNTSTCYRYVIDIGGANFKEIL